MTGCTPAAVETPDPQPTRGPLELTIGALVADTGSLDWTGPTSRAAVQVAVDDIAAAGFPVTVNVEFRDAGDVSSSVGQTSTTELLDLGVDAIVGPISNGVARTIIDGVVAAKVPLVSPGNDATDFSAFNDEGYYWRTSAPCTLQSATLAQQIAASGAKTAGVVATAGVCAEPLVSAVTTALQRLDVSVTSKTVLGEGASIDPGSIGLSPDAQDAVAVISRDIPAAVTPLEGAGFASTELFFALPAPRDYSADLPEGALLGTTVTRAGVDPYAIDGFADRIRAVDDRANDLVYAVETYDAVILIALAAFEANSTASEDIAGAIQDVSGGAEGSVPCTTFAACAASIAQTGVADYDGLSGPITFADNGDPTGAVVGIYVGRRDNTFERID